MKTEEDDTVHKKSKPNPPSEFQDKEESKTSSISSLTISKLQSHTNESNQGEEHKGQVVIKVTKEI